MSDSTSTTNVSVISKHPQGTNTNHLGKYVKLNIGNYFFLTSFDTLTKEDTMFKAMFSGRMEVVQDSEGKMKRTFKIKSFLIYLFLLGWVLIDRDGKHFNIILNYLRDGTVNLPDCLQTLNDLLQEAKFYCIESLIDLIEQQIRIRARKTVDYTDQCCKVIMLTSAKELPNIVATVRKPIVKLAINRHNNKYSYTA